MSGVIVYWLYQLRRKFWLLKLKNSDRAWRFTEKFPRFPSRRETFLLKRTNYYYKRYLSTDNPNFLNYAIEDLTQFLTSQEEPSTLNFVHLLGWAGSTDIKIQKILIRSSLEIVEVKINKKREDVAAFYNSKKFMKSGFEAVVKIIDEHELVHLEIFTKDGAPCHLTMNNCTNGVSVEHHNASISVGSIDSCEIIRTSILGKRALSCGVDLINLAELLISMSKLQECALVLALLEPIPAASDRRIDRARFVVGEHHKSKQSYELENLRVQHLDPGGIDKSPVVKCHIGHNIIVNFGSLLTSSDNSFLIADKGSRPEFEFVAGQHDFVVGSHMRLHEVQVPARSLPSQKIDKAVSLLGRNPENYFHSLIEYLPRYFTAMNSDALDEHFFLLNSELPSTVKFAAESLIPHERIKYVTKQDTLLVSELIIPTFHTQTFDSTVIPWEYSGLMNWEPIEQFSQRMIELHLGPNQRQKNLFAIRKGGLRSIPNVDMLIDIAENEGFDIVDLSALSFVEQVNRLHYCERAIIPGGAGLSGMIFMRPQSSVLTLATFDQQRLGTYHALAAGAHLELNYLLGIPTIAPGEAPFRMKEIHSPFVISPKEFKRAIRAM